MELVNGRPESAAGRLEKELHTYDFLDSLGVSYQRIDHEAAMTIDACQEIDVVLNAAICKNLFLCNHQKTDFYLLMMPGEKKFVTKDVCKKIPSPRLSFADESYMEEFLNITPGSVSIMGLMNDADNQVQLLIDEDVLKDPYIGCHPCINTSSLKIATPDILEKYLPAVHHKPITVHLENHIEEATEHKED